MLKFLLFFRLQTTCKRDRDYEYININHRNGIVTATSYLTIKYKEKYFYSYKAIQIFFWSFVCQQMACALLQNSIVQRRLPNRV